MIYIYIYIYIYIFRDRERNTVTQNLVNHYQRWFLRVLYIFTILVYIYIYIYGCLGTMAYQPLKVI